MANKSISQLTAGGAVSGTDLFPDVQTAGVGPVKVTATQLATFFWNSPTLVTPSLGAATATSINIGGATLGTNKLAVNGTTLLGGATTVSTGGLTIGVQQTTQGTLVLANTAVGAFTTTLQSSNSSTAAWTMTLPPAAPAGNAYVLTSTIGGVTSWSNPTALGIDLDVGTTAITNGTVGRVLFEGTGNVLQESANLFWDNTNARLGIGTATPTAALSVFTASTSPTSVGSGVRFLESTNGYGINLGGNSSGYAWIQGIYGGATTLGYNDIAIQPNGGNVGIGTSSPASKLNVNGSVYIEASSVYKVRYTSGSNTYSGNFGPFWLQLGNNGNNDFVAGSGAAGGYFRWYVNNTTDCTTQTNNGTLAMSLDATGNLTLPVSGARIYGDYSNATVTNRLSFQTSTTNGSTGIYALPNGTSTAASWQATNAADPTNASKILIATNASTDVQLVSGINGTGTYLPLSIYTSGGQSAQFSTTKGTFTLGVAGTATGILNLTGATSGTTAITVPAVAGPYTWTIPNSGANVSFGYLNIPQNAQTSAYVAAIGDVGKHISITTGGVTVNASVFSAGDVFTIYNNSGSSQNITAGSGVTFRLAGTATSGTPRTVAQYGLATVLCVTGGASPVFVLSGAGVA